MKDQGVFKRRIPAQLPAGIKQAWRLRAGVNLGISFVDGEDEIVAPGVSDGIFELIEGRDRALGVGRGVDIGQSRAGKVGDTGSQE